MSILRPRSAPSEASQRRQRYSRPRITRSLAAQVIPFLASGGFATAIHWTVMALLIRGGSQPVLATAIGAFVGSVFNYLFQFHWTFNGVGIHSKAIPAYASTAILGWCVNAGIFYFLISIAHAGQGLAQVCTTAVVAAMNFILYKRVVFHERIN